MYEEYVPFLSHKIYCRYTIKKLKYIENRVQFPKTNKKDLPILSIASSVILYKIV